MSTLVSFLSFFPLSTPRVAYVHPSPQPPACPSHPLLPPPSTFFPPLSFRTLHTRARACACAVETRNSRDEKEQRVESVRGLSVDISSLPSERTRTCKRATARDVIAPDGPALDFVVFLVAGSPKERGSKSVGPFDDPPPPPPPPLRPLSFLLSSRRDRREGRRIEGEHVDTCHHPSLSDPTKKYFQYFSKRPFFGFRPRKCRARGWCVSKQDRDVCTYV